MNMKRESYFDGATTSELIAKILEMYLEGDCSPATKEKILDWLADPENREEKEQAFEKVWHEYVKYNPHPGEEAYRSYDALARKLRLPGAQFNIPARHPWKKRMLRVAAVLLPFLLLAGLLYLNSRYVDDTELLTNHGESVELFFEEALKNEGAVRVVVPEKQKNSLLLPDGTYVLLSGGVTLVYDMENRVYLSGEGFFRAPKRTELPLVVKTPDLTITVLGTAFNVDARPVSATHTVSLYSGSVRVEAGEMHHILSPDMRLSYAPATSELQLEPMDSYLPEWVTRELRFVQKPLAEVFRTLQWFYNFSFHIAESVDVEQEFTFTMNGSESLETLLLMMQKAGAEFGYRIEGEEVYIDE